MCPCDLRVNRNKPKICSIGIKPINYKNMNLKTVNHLATFLFVFIMSFQFSLFFFSYNLKLKMKFGTWSLKDIPMSQYNNKFRGGPSSFMLAFTSVKHVFLQEQNCLIIIIFLKSYQVNIDSYSTITPKDGMNFKFWSFVDKEIWVDSDTRIRFLLSWYFFYYKNLLSLEINLGSIHDYCSSSHIDSLQI